MKCNLAGACGNAADVIDKLLLLIHALDKDESDTLEDELADIQPTLSAFVLREIAGHAAATAKGEHSIDEFAEHYCLKREVINAGD